MTTPSLEPVLIKEGDEEKVETLEYDMDLSKVQVPERFTSPVLYDATIDQSGLTSQATVVKTQYEAVKSFTTNTVSPNQTRRVGPQTVTVNAAGEYNFSISADGSIRLIRVSGGGSVKVGVGGSYSATKYACAAFETQTITRWIRFEQFNYYSDGRKVATGAYHNEKQPSQYGDSTTRRVGSWTVC
ncbi:hypothetical protein GCM10017783_21550 [Deinococcus piscis]|uniref:PA14 domain-containing protein n=1 Tax=Deinococcus piscis TaxID=394230 RepID=A0ABQ3KDE9_9DEIO|nr:hypothetical protein GCM10017783_21550 [Deinococcus piscis]